MGRTCKWVYMCSGAILWVAFSRAREVMLHLQANKLHAPLTQWACKVLHCTCPPLTVVFLATQNGGVVSALSISRLVMWDVVWMHCHVQSTCTVSLLLFSQTVDKASVQATNTSQDVYRQQKSLQIQRTKLVGWVGKSIVYISGSPPWPTVIFKN